MNDVEEIVKTRFETKRTIHVDYNDLHRITEIVYGKQIQILEASNDSDHSYTVDGEMDDYDIETLEEAIKSGGLECWQYSAILNDLCKKGMIETGDYYVSVCW